MEPRQSKLIAIQKIERTVEWVKSYGKTVKLKKDTTEYESDFVEENDTESEYSYCNDTEDSEISYSSASEAQEVEETGRDEFSSSDNDSEGESIENTSSEEEEEYY